MNSSNRWELATIERLSKLPKYKYKRYDFIQDAIMFIGGIGILIYWLYQVGQAMLYVAH